MMRRRYKSKIKLVTDVQMTSFMDVSFLLLIVFMLTAPALEQGTDVNPPQMDAKPLEEEHSKVVTLNARGEMVFDHEPVNEAQLLSQLQLLIERTPDLIILVRADQAKEYGKVIELLKIVKKSGAKHVSLVTEAEDVK